MSVQTGHRLVVIKKNANWLLSDKLTKYLTGIEKHRIILIIVYRIVYLCGYIKYNE